jgi:hypothetical protein
MSANPLDGMNGPVMVSVAEDLNLETLVHTAMNELDACSVEDVIDDLHDIPLDDGGVPVQARLLHPRKDVFEVTNHGEDEPEPEMKTHGEIPVGNS